ncbi:MAG: hypothetical protein IBX71_07060, partial [Candidatus Desulforudis sp.]|nr:hypothetical protein [Desulforudis sp.]
RVGRWTVNVELVPAGEDLPAPPPPRVKTVTVASPRLDAVIAAAFNLSRSRVGRWTVNVELVPAGEDLPAPPPPRVKTVTVASPRLDAVIAAAFNLSRSRAAEFIRQGRVSLNWRPETGPDAQVKTGDTLSCRGQGRFMLLENSGPTHRRGRQRLHLGFPADPAPKNS